MRSWIRVAIAGLMLALAAPALADERPLPSLELDGIAQAIGALPAFEITVDDPAYKTEKHFLAYSLRDVLATLPDLEDWRSKGAALALKADDGYSPVMDLDLALRAEGYLAVRDQDAPNGQPWLPLRHGKEWTTPGPYYLIWPGQNSTDPRFPWPYRIVSMALVRGENLFPAARPQGNDELANKGFAQFRQSCISCHSVNLAGGTIGPELNVPKSVAEYLPEATLTGIIRQASAFRAHTKMPDFSDLSDADINALAGYLKHMAGHKVCDTAKECAKR